MIDTGGPAGGTDGTIVVWEIKMQRAVERRFNGVQNGVFSLVFSPNNRSLASGGMDGKLSKDNQAYTDY
jgi:WD40 repeat protein